MATRSAKIDQKADLIWAIADKLTGVYKPHEYGDVILPLTVIRRFDCIVKYLERILKCFHLVLEKMLTGCRRIFYSARKEEMPIRHLMSL